MAIMNESGGAVSRRTNPLKEPWHRRTQATESTRNTTTTTMNDRQDVRFLFGKLNVTTNANECTVMTGSRSNTVTMNMNMRMGVRKIKISVRLSKQDAPLSNFVDMHISRPYVIPKKKNFTGDNWYDNRGVFHGTRNQYAMCSLYVQIGKLLGVRPRNREKSMFEEIYRHWRLCTFRPNRGGLIRTLDDLVDGDRLTLHCGSFHKSSHLTKDCMKRLPSEYKDVVKVSLISPLRDCDHHASAGSSENINSSNKLPKVAAAPGKQITTDRRPIVAPVVHRPKHSNEVIVISSDDESEASSVDDVTDEWRAKREEERRKMRENAEEID